jgi:thymidylate kinase
MEFARAIPGISIEGLFFDIPIEEVLKRNAFRGESDGKFVSEDYLKQVYAELVQYPPKPEEGFDVLLRIDKERKVTAIQTNPDSILSLYFGQ